jgi:hypothetical protein
MQIWNSLTGLHIGTFMTYKNALFTGSFDFLFIGDNFTMYNFITIIIHRLNKVVWLFILHDKCFSYLAAVAITSDRAANFNLCLYIALVAFGSEGSFICQTCCDTGPPFIRSYPKDLLNAEFQRRSNHYLLQRLRFDAAGRSRTQTHDLPNMRQEVCHWATTTGIKEVWFISLESSI